MSKQANPLYVGAFVVVGAFLALLIVALIGSFRAFKARQTFVIYFPSSVNNLSVGSKVKWKGVPVGQVSDVRIRWNQDELSTEIPVFVQIELDRLGMELDEPEVMKSEIENGMRAQLQWDSLISGMLYIELNYVPNAPEPEFFQEEQIYPEIPTTPSPLDAIGDIATEVTDNLRQLDFKRISDNLNNALVKAGKLMDDIDAQGISSSVKSAANTVTGLAASPEVTRLIDEATETMRQIKTLAAKLEGTAGPLPEQLAKLSAKLDSTLDSVNGAASAIKTSVSDNSQTMVSLEQALRDLSDAARSAQDLASFLERNPTALIGGRSTTSNSD